MELSWRSSGFTCRRAYYAALKCGEASEALAIMGGFSSVATALVGIALLAQPGPKGALPGFILITEGGFVMFLTGPLDLRRTRRQRD